MPSSGESSASGSPVVSQCASYLAARPARQRMRRQRHLLERAVGEIGGEQPANDSSDASSARPRARRDAIARSSAARGRRPAETGATTRTKNRSSTPSSALRAQRELQVAAQRPGERRRQRRRRGRLGAAARPARLIRQIATSCAGAAAMAERQVGGDDGDAAGARGAVDRARRTSALPRRRAPSSARRAATAGASSDQARQVRAASSGPATAARSADCAGARARPPPARAARRRTARRAARSPSSDQPSFRFSLTSARPSSPPRGRDTRGSRAERRVAGPADRPGLGPREAGERAQQRRLAAAVRSGHSDPLARTDRERQRRRTIAVARANSPRCRRSASDAVSNSASASRRIVRDGKEVILPARRRFLICPVSCMYVAKIIVLNGVVLITRVRVGEDRRPARRRVSFSFVASR